LSHEAVDLGKMERSLEAHGYAVLDQLLAPARCVELSAQYNNAVAFRKRVVMSRHSFGQGEYQYFAYPLPSAVQTLRARLYAQLAGVANEWQRQLRVDRVFPESHEAFLDECRRGGQTAPTPLMLRYQRGDYNCLHQDVYGDHMFPIQVAILLSAPGLEFVGGEFVLTEQRPRMQSKVTVVPLKQGDAVAFAVSHRPALGKRGWYRANTRHGVSPLQSGLRHTLGIIFHDALEPSGQ
jgi:uncharacterized protein